MFCANTGSAFIACPCVFDAELSAVTGATSSDVNNPTYDPLNTTNNESRYIRLLEIDSVKCCVSFCINWCIHVPFVSLFIPCQLKKCLTMCTAQ